MHSHFAGKMTENLTTVLIEPNPEKGARKILLDDPLLNNLVFLHKNVPSYNIKNLAEKSRSFDFAQDKNSEHIELSAEFSGDRLFIPNPYLINVCGNPKEPKRKDRNT